MILGPVISVKWSMESDTYGFCFVLIKMGLKEAEDKRTLDLTEQKILTSS